MRLQVRGNLFLDVRHLFKIAGDDQLETTILAPISHGTFSQHKDGRVLAATAC
jgi:hypothetical protein